MVTLSENRIKKIVKRVIPLHNDNPDSSIATIQYRMLKNRREKLASKLRNVDIPESKLEPLIEKMITQYRSSLAVPGDSVGIITAQSIGERQTQLTLNTFHSAGLIMSAVTTGVPRFRELISISSKKKAESNDATIILYPNIDIFNRSDMREYVDNNIIDVTVGMLLNKDLSKQVCHNPWFKLYKSIYNKEYEVDDESYDFVQLDQLQMRIKKITLKDIVSKLDPKMGVIPSPSIFCSLAIPKDYTSSVMNKSVKGIPKVHKVYYESKIGEKKLHVKIVGGEFMNILSNDFILEKFDLTTLYSSSINNIYNVFGIETARYYLEEELTNAISEKKEIHKNHISLLVDSMTYKGIIESISRDTQKKSSAYSPFAKMSFEQTQGMIVKSAINNETDHCTGISSAIALSKPGNCGTGMAEINIDPDSFQ